MTLDSMCLGIRSLVPAWVSPLPMVAMSVLLLGGLTIAQAAPSGNPRGPAQAASAVPTDVHARPVFGPLQAGQIEQIQSLGRSVLTAKHGQQPTAQEQALVGELHALSGEIDQAILPHDGKVELRNGESPSRATSAALPAGEALRNRLQPYLTRLHERRTALNGSVESLQPEAREAHQARMQHLSDRVAEIEQAVQSAMALPDEERHARLVELSHRLKPRSQDELLREQHATDAAEHPGTAASAIDLDHPTPTLTTLIEHRPGLTGQGPDIKFNGHPASTSRTGKLPAKH